MKEQDIFWRNHITFFMEESTTISINEEFRDYL
jgi:hypothetical protein